MVVVAVGVVVLLLMPRRPPFQESNRPLSGRRRLRRVPHFVEDSAEVKIRRGALVVAIRYRVANVLQRRDEAAPSLFKHCQIVQRRAAEGDPEGWELRKGRGGGRGLQVRTVRRLRGGGRGGCGGGVCCCWLGRESHSVL